MSFDSLIELHRVASKTYRLSYKGLDFPAGSLGAYVSLFEFRHVFQSMSGCHAPQFSDSQISPSEAERFLNMPMEKFLVFEYAPDILVSAYGQQRNFSLLAECLESDFGVTLLSTHLIDVVVSEVLADSELSRFDAVATMVDKIRALRETKPSVARYLESRSNSVFRALTNRFDASAMKD